MKFVCRFSLNVLEMHATGSELSTLANFHGMYAVHGKQCNPGKQKSF
jgi:hypothetical protein